MDSKTSLLDQLNDSNLSLDERAHLRCHLARELEDAGQYEEAHRALGDLWPHLVERPLIDALDSGTAAQVLLRAGALLGWIGKAKQIAGAQEAAKDLISESIEIYESLGEPEKAAGARSDLSVCYWREGLYDEAQIILRNALDQFKNDLDQKALALARLALAQRSANHPSDALWSLNEAAPLVKESASDSLKGRYHVELAMTLRNLGTAERREDYIDRAIVEFTAASFHFEQAGHTQYFAAVENNLGFLLFKTRQFEEAHEHLNRARRLFTSLRDKSHVAQVDDTRARALLAQGHYSEAERIARASVCTLEHGDEHAALSEALLTHGTALARLSHTEQAFSTLQRALELAARMDDIYRAGLSALTIVEELGETLTVAEMLAFYEQADDKLAQAQQPETTERLRLCARRVLDTGRDLLMVADREQSLSHAVDALAQQLTRTAQRKGEWQGCSLEDEVLRYEGSLIRLALDTARGHITQAARLLGITHQGLSYILQGRHKSLLAVRKPPKARRRSIFKIPSRQRVS
jgi:tetratricopeptide (TPR) repeat protein